MSNHEEILKRIAERHAAGVPHADINDPILREDKPAARADATVPDDDLNGECWFDDEDDEEEQALEELIEDENDEEEDFEDAYIGS